MKTTVQIIRDYIKENDSNGLCNQNGKCWCDISYLLENCCDDNKNCIPAKKRFCKNCMLNNDCEWQMESKCDFCYYPN